MTGIINVCTAEVQARSHFPYGTNQPDQVSFAKYCRSIAKIVDQWLIAAAAGPNTRLRVPSGSSKRRGACVQLPKGGSRPGSGRR